MARKTCDMKFACHVTSHSDSSCGATQTRNHSSTKKHQKQEINASAVSCIPGEQFIASILESMTETMDSWFSIGQLVGNQNLGWISSPRPFLMSWKQGIE
jgi:hypothetical protein